MYQRKQIFRFKIEHLLIFTLLVLLLASCKNERPQTIVTTPTPAPTGESTTAIDPTIAAVLAQVSPTPEITPTTESDSTPTQTPEFVCTPPANWVAYTVQPNDTLIAIANALGISVGDIKNANCKLDDTLTVSEIIYLPKQPTIPQLPLANTQLDVSINTIQESVEIISQDLPEGIVRELAYLTGGGGMSLVRKCGELDGKPGPILVSDQESLHLSSSLKFELVICEPLTQTFSATLHIPSGEEIPFSFPEYTSESHVHVSVNLPLGHPPGIYKVTINDYPESGDIIEKEVYLQKGTPTMRENFEDRTITLYYFEPYETVYLAAYNVSDGGNARLIDYQTYQINEDGYLVITIPNDTWPDPAPEKWPPFDTRFAVVGEQSGFASDWQIAHRLIVKNNGLEPVCEFQVTLTGENEWSQLISPGLFPIESGQEWSWDGFNPGYYDIEAKNCNNEIIKKSEDVDLTQGITTWDIP